MRARMHPPFSWRLKGSSHFPTVPCVARAGGRLSRMGKNGGIALAAPNLPSCLACSSPWILSLHGFGRAGHTLGHPYRGGLESDCLPQSRTVILAEGRPICRRRGGGSASFLLHKKDSLQLWYVRGRSSRIPENWPSWTVPNLREPFVIRLRASSSVWASPASRHSESRWKICLPIQPVQLARNRGSDPSNKASPARVRREQLRSARRTWWPAGIGGLATPGGAC